MNTPTQSSSNASPKLIRPSDPADLPVIAAIYGWNVENGSGTFETEVPSVEDMGRRRDEVLSRGLPWLVIEQHGVVLGFAYANYFRPRLAYRYCVEDSIYLAEGAGGKGLGTLLLAELVGQCEARGARQMMAVIGDSANLASVSVHRALGFSPCGVMHSTGWKFGRWIDVVLMQRQLGLGDSTPPTTT